MKFLGLVREKTSDGKFWYPFFDPEIFWNNEEFPNEIFWYWDKKIVNEVFCI